MRYCILVLLCLSAPALFAQAQADGSSPRPWLHQISTTVGLSKTEPPAWTGEAPRTKTGVGLAYHIVRPLGRLRLGLGGGAELMDEQWRQTLLQLTGLAEYQLGNRRVRPIARLLLGANLPLGNNDLRLESRAIGPVVHPSLGLVLHPPHGSRGSILLDVGYRFSRVDYSVLDVKEEPIDRQIDYRRLTFTLATRF
ncbi:hypothetical protein LEM8419_02921 [Neolewinella maritima]|uniref:Outer membrane protein beta-barrel domain-containing protein n=1 Tax=Neolewinella maritima TaxID=1383882 RepID=A0ABM9B491_9BACT|nr:hypothetical protein [Neolewinella maritima]CAH1002006.1 hypothetical protein LEM8419_02921 [Neolewinella maritima]